MRNVGVKVIIYSGIYNSNNMLTFVCLLWQNIPTYKFKRIYRDCFR